MEAPNPTTKQNLKLTKQMHSCHTLNNIPRSIPAITNIVPWHSMFSIAVSSDAAPRWSLHLTNSTKHNTLQCIPKVHFVPVPGNLRQHKLVSQEGINILTDCVWEKSPAIFTPDKLKPKHSPTCLDFTQVAMLMVHPKTVETISSY
jgi:hypothetical protein